MQRKQAIEQYSKIKLAEFSKAERAEQLETMSSEDWSDAQDWNTLSKSIRDELSSREEIKYPESEQYNPVLMMWLKYTFQSVSNDFLCRKLNINNVIGYPVELESCPCCGYKTIEERGHYDICIVCWWEDDGHDNENSLVAGGPNKEISLAMGRYNYLVYGLFNQKRTDLMKLKAEQDMFVKGRIFEIIENQYLIEKGTDWKWKIILPNNI